MVAHCVRAAVAMSCANALAQGERELKASRQVAKRMGLAPSPGGSVANESRLGEAESATNPPKGWDEGQKGMKAAALLVLAEAGDAGQR